MNNKTEHRMDLAGQIGDVLIHATRQGMVLVAGGTALVIGGVVIIRAGHTACEFIKKISKIEMYEKIRSITYGTVSFTPLFLTVYCLSKSSYKQGTGDIDGMFEYGIPIAGSALASWYIYEWLNRNTSNRNTTQKVYPYV